MVKKTNRWKHFHRGMWITNIIHFIIGLAPVLALLIAGFTSGTIGMTSKFAFRYIWSFSSCIVNF